MASQRAEKSAYCPHCSSPKDPLLGPMAVAPSESTKSPEKTENQEKLFYKVQDVPQWSTTILFGIQQVLVCASGVVAMPLVIAEILCAGANPLAKVKLMGTLMFITGFSTILQSTFGVRLPLLQGPSFAFLPSIIALMSMPQYLCKNDRNTASLLPNTAAMTNESVTYDADDEWMGKMRIVQGGLISAAAFEMLFGLTGIIGFVTRHVGPLTIAPLMLMLEFSVVKVCVSYGTQHWMSGVTVGLLLVVALYMHLVKVPLPTYKSGKFTITKFPLFAIFPYLIGISFVWILCVIFTATNVFNVENHSAVRTDLRSQIIRDAPWFRWPYPFQWGFPEFNIGVVLGMFAATLASIIESIGDYNACARAAHVPPPPLHAVNRGILMEGFCCLIGGMMGGGLGVTTYSENIGVIGITKVASRRTMQVAGVIFLLLGMFTKVGAVLTTIPDPLVGGILTVSCAMVGGVGLSSVQLVDLRLSRNSAILGFAIMLGILVPAYFKEVPIRTGNETVDQALGVLLSINIFVAGVVGFILDNTIPGATKRQRGLIANTDNSKSVHHRDENGLTVYSFPPPVMKYLSMCPISRYLPFLPRIDPSRASREFSNHDNSAL